MILVLASMLSVVFVAPVGHAHAASASDFIAQSYASNLSIKSTKTVNLMSFPSTASGSTVKYTVPADTVFTVKALHKNNDGKYFYEILYYNVTLYVDATETTMLDHLTGDVTLTGEASPSSLTYGTGFPIQGNITSKNNLIGKVTAAMYNGTNLSRTPALSSSDTVNGKSYNLTNSTVDKNLIFSDLPKGSYSYVVTAEAISYYIDDSGNLKTSKTTVMLENQICAVTNGSSPNPVLHNGIDVSVWNGNIDWAKVKNQTDFAILRASWEETADTKFTTNANGCVNNGLPFGVYVYSYAESAAEAIGEAKYVLSLVDGYDMDLPIFFDFEDECQMNLSASKQQEIVKAFCDTIYEGGRQPGLYTYVWLLRSVFTDNYYKTIPIWTAEINGASYTSYKGGLWMWQWLWVGQFNGMTGDVDCNKMYVDLPEQNKSDTSYLSKCTYYPTNFNGTLTEAQNVRQYPSTDYSIIKSSLAAGTKVHVTGLYKNAYGNLWYQIEIDGVTGYIGGDVVSIDEYLYNDIAIHDPKMASNLDVGKGFYIEGNLTSSYNNLTTVRASVYSGENTLTTPTLTSTYKENDKGYSLYKSEVDYGLNFGKLAAGYYTYEVSVDVTSYYCTNNTLASRTEKVVVWKNPLTVGGVKITPPESLVCNHDIVTLEGKVPTCTENGLTVGTSCSKCGEVISEQAVIPALGHEYVSQKVSSSCFDYEKMQFTCSNCNHSYVEYVQYEWTDVKPEDYSETKYETKTQYRYSDLQTTTSDKSSLDGYTLISKGWQDKGNTTINYAKFWPAGFDKTHSTYSTYNKTPKTNSETETTKYQIVTAEKANGWLYYHWCAGTYQYGPINRGTSATKTAEYPAFHAYYSTENPASKDKGNATDGSVIAPNSNACKDSQWYYNVPIYTQTYKTYTAVYTHGKWGSWSQWSDTAVTASDTRKVETRELYRQLPQKGEHKFSRGKCNVCDYVCPHKWENGKCQLCKMSCIHKWHNGMCTVCNQPCNHSWSNGICATCNTACSHSWQDGICTVCSSGCAHNWSDNTCTNCGYVCAKHIYRDGVCSVCKTPCPGHVWVGDVCSICSKACTHDWNNGICNDCNAVCEHAWRDGKCTICLIPCDHNYENGKCTICQLVCKHNWTNGVCSMCSMVCTHNWKNGVCTTCNAKCSHNWVDSVCTVCTMNCAHNWHNGVCKDCNAECDHTEWVNGSCKVCNKVCVHNWEDSTCTVCGKQCKHIWHNGKCLLCECVCEHTWEDGKCSECTVSCKHKWNNYGVCTICLTECKHELDEGYCLICNCECPAHEWSDSVCVRCNMICSEHIYSSGECAICHRAEPEYYLVGFINGKDYGINNDHKNNGELKFVDGKLVVTFTENSYVMLKAPEDDNYYMTNGYPPEGTTTVTLYNAVYLYENGCKDEKLFVPKGREITFTLVNNGNDTFTLSYVAAVCEHKTHNAEGTCDICSETVKHTFSQGACTVCSLACEHNWQKGKCTVCALTCEHTWKNSVCTTCSLKCAHTWTEDGCADCGKLCAHSWFDGACMVCGVNCSHVWKNGECSVCRVVCDHSYVNGSCIVCSISCNHIWTDGTCSVCNLVCQHKWLHGDCTLCDVVCDHMYSNGKCTICQIAQYYLVGYINNETVGYNENYTSLGNYKFTEGSITLSVKYDSYFFVKTSDNKNWYMVSEDTGEMVATLYNTKTGKASEMLFIPGGVTVEFTIRYNKQRDTLSIICYPENCIHTIHSKDGICRACEEEVEHTYISGKCTGCGILKPVQDMYLFGVINGNDYGYNTDGSNVGEYKFVDGEIVVSFARDSYVGIKTADNKYWYMTNGKYAQGITSAVMYNTRENANPDLLYIPGGNEVRIQIVYNGDDSFSLSYDYANTPKLQIKPKYISLSLEDEIRYDVCFTVDIPDLVSPEDMGLITFSYNVSVPTIENATDVISGAEYNGTNFTVKTNPVHPKEMGDTLFFRVYAKLPDGSYAYSDMMNYSALRYANLVLSNKYSSVQEKTLMVALLNYGAAAQKYHNYKTDSLVNANLTDEQRVLVKKYSADMLSGIIVASSDKTSEFKKQGTGFMLYPTVDAQTAGIHLNYNLKTTKNISGTVTLYYWDAETYATADKLTAANAAGKLIMQKNEDGVYAASVEEISAVNMDSTVYTAVVFESEGGVYCSGVMSYSYAEYCKVHAESKTSDLRPLSQAAIVYGYYLKEKFAE